MSKPAFVVIDVQNDCFEGDAFPPWNAAQPRAATEQAIRMARSKDRPVVFVQHVPVGPAVFRRADDDRKVTVLTDASTTVTEMLHRIAVAGLSTRVALATAHQAPA